MIRQLEPSDFTLAAKVIRDSNATVAKDLGLTEQNCPKFVGFVTTAERLQTHHSWGWWIYGLYENEELVGYVSVSKEYVPVSEEYVPVSEDADKTYEINNLAVLPEYRHKSYGKQLLDFSMKKIMDLGGKKVIISIIEENAVLRNWYAAYGFVHTGTKKFEHLPFTSGYMELVI